MGIIYLLTVEGDNKKRFLVGQTRRKLNRRISGYKCSLSKNLHNNQRLQNCYNKFGWDSISFSILEICDNVNMEEREKFFIKHLDTFQTKHGLNLTSGGEQGKFHSEETKQKIRLANLGKKATLETKKKLSVARKGRKPNLGKHHSEETKTNIAKKLGNKIFSIIHDDGTKITDLNKNKIANKIGVSRRHLRRLINGEIKITKGWKICE